MMMNFRVLFFLFLPFFCCSQMKEVTYSDGNVVLNGNAYLPKTPHKNKAGILILPAWMGITSHEQSVAEDLSKQGYYVFIADIYGKDNRPKNREEAAKISGVYKKDFLLYQRRIRLALDQLIKHGANPNQLASLGYCFGGGGAIEMARANMPVQGIVSLHGTLSKDVSRPNGPITTKVLILHGADDFFIPQKDITYFEQEMRDAKADWQFISYGNAVHAFSEKTAGNDVKMGVAYNELADKRSIKAYLQFFEELFN